MTYGEALYRARKALKISRPRLAAQAGIACAALARIEKGGCCPLWEFLALQQCIGGTRDQRGELGRLWLCEMERTSGAMKT